jgi:hypothetical protein
MRSSGTIPNAQEWHLISDSELNNIFDRPISDIVGDDVLQRSVYVYRCERCDRLHVYWDGIGEWPPAIYVREDT